MPPDFVKLLSAASFAAEAHRGQRRKDAGESPYINHPLGVAQLLAEVGGVRDLDVLAAALLHDTVEDTEVSPEEIAAKFGERVKEIVAELTDDMSLPADRRKALQVEHAPHLSDAAKPLKIADKISNLRDLSSESPAGWSLERKLQYVAWGEQVVAGCRGINPALDRLFDQTVREVRERLAAGTGPSGAEEE